MPNGQFKRGFDYPNEGFIQKAIEEYFESQGFKILNEKYTDLVCIHPETGMKWSVEAKGETKAIGLDFCTSLGQLLQRMSTKDVCYGIASHARHTSISTADQPGAVVGAGGVEFALAIRLCGWKRDGCKTKELVIKN